MADTDKSKIGDANVSTPAKIVHFSSTLSKITAAWTLADIKTTGNPNLARAAPNIAAAASAAVEPLSPRAFQPESSTAPIAAAGKGAGLITPTAETTSSPLFEPVAHSKILPAATDYFNEEMLSF